MNEFDAAVSEAIKFIAKKERSESEVLAYLGESFAPDIVLQAVERLKTRGMVNDLALAERLVAKKPWLSDAQLGAMFEARGIALEKVLAGLQPEIERAELALTKASVKSPNQALRKLISAGFEADTAQYAVERHFGL